MTHKEIIVRKLKDECKKQIQYYMSLPDEAFLKCIDNPNCKIEVNVAKIIGAYWYEHVQKVQAMNTMTVNDWLNAKSQQ